MPRSPADMYAHLLRNDLCAFIHRSFLELNPQGQFHSNWHIELIASKLEDVRRGHCRRLIVNVPPRHLKSHAISVAFPAWLLGHEPSKQVLSVTYAQDLSEDLARKSRSLMTSAYYQALFDTRLSREAISDFATTQGGNRFSTSVGGVLTGRGADIIIIDDPLKADDALSDTQRRSVNEWFANTLRSRLNNSETGAIIIVMQRLHADDLVAHVQEKNEQWDVLSFPAKAEQDQSYSFLTPYGRRQVHRKPGDILQPALFSAESLEARRLGMADYNFAAQYQQDPQPPSGIIVKREWLKYYRPDEKPERFDQILQSWDTANKDSELANFSVCTTWGIKDRSLFLLDVFRQKLDFPDLKRSIRELANRYQAKIVLIEDKASGTSLLQELRADNFSIAQPAPDPKGDKVIRLRAQTTKIANGTVLFPNDAPWLDAYLRELLGFPNAKNDDQVDSTVFALAWVTEHPEPGIITFYKKQVEEMTRKPLEKGMVRVWVAGDTTHWYLSTGWPILIPPDRIVEVSLEEIAPILRQGGKRVDDAAP
jgi:predicted phage terminase large subunit-like protein